MEHIDEKREIKVQTTFNDLNEVIVLLYDLFYSFIQETDELCRRLYNDESIQINKAIIVGEKLYDHNTLDGSISLLCFNRLCSIIIIGMPFDKRSDFLKIIVSKYFQNGDQAQMILKAFSVTDRFRFHCNFLSQLDGFEAIKALFDNVVVPCFQENNALLIFRHGSLLRMYWMDLLRFFGPDLTIMQYAGRTLTPISFVKAFAPVLDEFGSDHWSCSSSNQPLFQRITTQISKFVQQPHNIVQCADALIIEILIYSGSLLVKDLIFLDQPNLISNFSSTNGKTHLFDLFIDRIQFGAMTNSFVLDHLDCEYLISYLIGLYDHM